MTSVARCLGFRNQNKKLWQDDDDILIKTFEICRQTWARKACTWRRAGPLCRAGIRTSWCASSASASCRSWRRNSRSCAPRFWVNGTSGNLNLGSDQLFSDVFSCKVNKGLFSGWRGQKTGQLFFEIPYASLQTCNLLVLIYFLPQMQSSWCYQVQHGLQIFWGVSNTHVNYTANN